ncbi:MAG: 50S ribosomal protein L18 [Candidatus Lambdaproteobacteria bacterium]|nr:50S ribosomal protein L18 [Candidatus Lambdaproteobacteria bacterium]
MSKTSQRLQRRVKRQHRIRRHVAGSSARPRLSVFRSAKHIYAQAIDDAAGVTLAAASTVDKALRGGIDGYTGNRNAAAQVGRAIAERLLKAGVEAVVFDRGGNRYHGRVKALADAAREGGLKF